MPHPPPAFASSRSAAAPAARRRSAPFLLLLLLAVPAHAAPAPEVLREEAYNYRIVGELPKGWKRRAEGLAFVLAVDEIPHAYVHLLRDRLDGAVDVEEQMKLRAPSYRFPGAPEGAESVQKTKWAGRDAFLLEHEAVVNGVRCRRRVTAFVAAGIWYERIETLYGDATERLAACREGLALFRDGFRLLVEPLTAEVRTDLAERTIESAEFGFRLTKPQGFVRKEVDLAADPGLRVAFETRLAERRNVLVRLFEYGVRDDLDAKAWLDIFYEGFSEYVTKPQRAPAEAPKVPGAADALAEIFLGERDGRPVEETVVLVRASSGRILCLRIRSSGDAHPNLKLDLQVNG